MKKTNVNALIDYLLCKLRQGEDSNLSVKIRCCFVLLFLPHPISRLTLSSMTLLRPRRTVVWINQESRCKYWATRLSVRSSARTAHSFACSGLFASLTPSAALTCSLARSLRSLPRSWESELLMSQNDLVLSHSAAVME